MRCPRCGNTDRAYFYKGSRGWYCRKCISFGRMMLEETQAAVSLSPISEGSEEYTLQYPLTAAQANAAQTCARAIETTDVVLHCCCGAGKTELVVLSISEMLAQGKTVCFAIPRRQVVLELQNRLAEYFPHAVVTAVCGGHTSVVDGDLIVCTTHQLYRYAPGTFDLLILDEPDAFPFRGNAVLHGIAASACRGRMIFLSATPDEEMKRRIRRGTLREIKLNRRPHGHDMPVPKIITAPGIVLFVILLNWLLKRNGPRMVFVPTIREAALLQFLLRRFVSCCSVTSRSKDRDAVIERFRMEKHGVMVTTTVMERGVTIPGVDICVFHADHDVFDEASLIQMAGRAGRTFEYPDGEVLFLQTSRSERTEQCRDTITEANACAV